MTATYIALATTTLASATSSITFSSIPSTYRDLVIIGSFNGGTAGTFSIRANGDSGNNYSRAWMLGSGSGSGNSGSSANNAYRLLSYGSTRCTGIAQLMDYSATNLHKTLLWRGNDSSAEVISIAGRWANNAAINSLTIFSDGGTFVAGSTFSIFGIN